MLNLFPKIVVVAIIFAQLTPKNPSSSGRTCLRVSLLQSSSGRTCLKVSLLQSSSGRTCLKVSLLQSSSGRACLKVFSSIFSDLEIFGAKLFIITTPQNNLG